MQNNFKVAPLSTTAIVWTVSYALVLLYFAYRVAGGDYSLYSIGAVVILLGVLIYGYIRSVRSYNLAAGAITVVRVGPGRVNIPLSDIVSVQTQADMGGFYNPTLLSIGGVFGWASAVQVRKPLDVRSVRATVYGTNSKNSVSLTLREERLIILTPADPAEFVKALRQVGIGGSSTSTGKPSAPAAARAGRRK